MRGTAPMPAVAAICGREGRLTGATGRSGHCGASFAVRAAVRESCSGSRSRGHVKGRCRCPAMAYRRAIFTAATRPYCTSAAPIYSLASRGALTTISDRAAFEGRRAITRHRARASTASSCGLS